MHDREENFIEGICFFLIKFTRHEIVETGFLFSCIPTKIFKFQVTWGRCYDHNFRRFSAKKMVFFSKKQCDDQILA
jgi:hypothetical protein